MSSWPPTNLSAVFERRRLLTIWRGGVAVAVFLWLYPVAYRWTRILVVGLMILLWIGSLLLWRRSKSVRVVCVLMAVMLVAILTVPGRAGDPERLRAAYVQALPRYCGTSYVWGGENGFGIDCSGLVRQGLSDALFKEGLTTINARLLRASLALRWFDCSADALRNEYRHFTRRLSAAESLKSADYSRLLKGDLAVTADGVHVLAYLGEQKWIEADPDAHRVIILNVEDGNPWLAVPVEIVRWRCLDTTTQGTQ